MVAMTDAERVRILRTFIRSIMKNKACPQGSGVCFHLTDKAAAILKEIG